LDIFNNTLSMFYIRDGQFNATRGAKEHRKQNKIKKFAT